jgi:bifunctional UDP-N-acetylglucosamine pyrophosphorylase / glucosamine-1-phosphate N-acetyltransferase
MKQNVTVVILAAGLGTRMKSRKAKVLHQAGGDTLLNQVIRAARAIAPGERIIGVVGHQADDVKRSVRERGVQFALQTEQKGTGHAVNCTRELAAGAPGQLLILNGDGPLLKGSTLERFLSTGEGLAGSIITTELADPTGYGRIVRNAEDQIAAIVEHQSASAEQKAIREINAGYYWFDAALFWRHIDEIQPNADSGEYYLTDMVEILRRHGQAVIPMPVQDETELLGINTKVELSVADRILRQRKAEALMLAGVTIERPETVTIDPDVQIGQDTVIEERVTLRGNTTIGADCRVGLGSVLENCVLADGALVLPYVVAEHSKIGSAARVGPFSRLRPNADIGEHCHVGNFVELKNTRMEDGSKANHLAYLGDAEIGSKTNVGAGTITCNYDGINKHKTTIAKGVFVGSNATLVAPLTLGEGSYIAAGSTITEDVEADGLAFGRARQVDKPLGAKRLRAKMATQK